MLIHVHTTFDKHKQDGIKNIYQSSRSKISLALILDKLARLGGIDYQWLANHPLMMAPCAPTNAYNYHVFLDGQQLYLVGYS
jgi:hypothetical protein